MQAIKTVKNELGELDGITTFCEMAVPLSSRLAEVLGLPHNSVEAVDNARDKHATRSVMEKAGLPTPLHYRIEQPEDVEKAGAHVGFPAVIKPVAGAASIGVIRVNDLEHLKAAYARVMSDMSKARIVAGALVEGVEGGEAGNAGGWIKTVLMLEEYLDGDEVDCDLIFDGGQPRYGAITDNWPTVEPYFNETGSNCPSILPREKQVGGSRAAAAWQTACREGGRPLGRLRGVWRGRRQGACEVRRSVHAGGWLRCRGVATRGCCEVCMRRGRGS